MIGLRSKRSDELINQSKIRENYSSHPGQVFTENLAGVTWPITLSFGNLSNFPDSMSTWDNLGKGDSEIQGYRTKLSEWFSRILDLSMNFHSILRLSHFTENAKDFQTRKPKTVAIEVIRPCLTKRNKSVLHRPTHWICSNLARTIQIRFVFA
jgi:hypothetical protein